MLDNRRYDIISAIELLNTNPEYYRPRFEELEAMLPLYSLRTNFWDLAGSLDRFSDGSSRARSIADTEAISNLKPQTSSLLNTAVRQILLREISLILSITGCSRDGKTVRLGMELFNPILSRTVLADLNGYKATNPQLRALLDCLSEYHHPSHA